jgi:hypothetical protein
MISTSLRDGDPSASLLRHEYVFRALLNCPGRPVVLRTRSYRTLRDGSFGWCFSRHFVPGYDQLVPPGQKPFASLS